MIFTENFHKYNLPFHGVRLPQIKVPDKDNYTYLTELCLRRFEDKLNRGIIDPTKAEIYTERCKTELGVLRKHNLVDYVLLVEDILSFCDRNNVARGVSRGSAGGSLVFYLLNCIKIDPIKYELPFTRFISEARLKSNTVDGVVFLNGKSIPDFDMDLSYLRRNEVIAYLEQKHPGKVSKISTTITFSGKILIKDCCKAFLNYTEQQATEISSMVERHFGKVEKLSETYKDSADFKKWVDANPKNKECFQIAQKLEELARARGQHPSGICVSFFDILETLPLDLSPAKDVVTCYDMNSVAEITVKLDFLGLKNADINQQVCELIGTTQDAIDVNHESIYNFYQYSADYFGLFQIERGLTKKTVIEVKPKNLEQLACCLSLSRPGTYKDIPKYLDYIHKGKLESIYPEIDKLLSKTANVLLYQEQVIELLVKVYKFPEVDADMVRYAIGKKLKAEMLKWEPVLFQKGNENNIPEEVTQKIWETMRDSADYQFSKNHATPYAMMTAINTYLKVNHPKEFFLCLLKMTKNEPNSLEALNEIVPELPHFDIKLLPPHITKSDLDFTLQDGNIRFGLSSIKGISTKTIEKLNKFRSQYSNKFEIFHAAEQAKLGIGILSALIQAGCLDGYVQNRSMICLEAQLWRLLSEKEKMIAMQMGPENDFNLTAILRKLHKEVTNDKGKPFIKDSRRATIIKYYEPWKKIYDKNSSQEPLANYFYEKLLLGFSYSQSLKNLYKDVYPDLMPISEVLNCEEYDVVRFMGEVSEVTEGKTKAKGNKYVKLTVKDDTGSIFCYIFNQYIEENYDANKGKYEEGDIVFVRGKKKDGGTIFADSIITQTTGIFTKLSQLKDEKPTEDIEKSVDKT